MFGLRLRFQRVVSALKISDVNAPDLKESHLLHVAEKHSFRRLQWAKEKRYDLQDYSTLWEILGIDSVIVLENEEGESFRIGVSLFENEAKAQNYFYDLKNASKLAIRQELNIDKYWVIVVKWKEFPSEEEWIDILYKEIDDPNSANELRLINLTNVTENNL